MRLLSKLVLALATGAASATVEDCPGYKASNVVKADGALTADLTLAGDACDIYGKDLKELKLLVEYQTDSRLHVKIYDAGVQVYQIQESVLPRPSSEGVAASDSKLQFDLSEDPFSFFVTRAGSDDVLFSTNGSSLVFEDQYLYLRTRLPKDPNLYGLGEHSDSFRLGTKDYRRTFWNAESPFIPRKSNLYGSHPNYLEHRGKAGSHGVALLNSNGMDININQTSSGEQYLEYNVIGGVFDFYFLAGPSPSDVSRQYAEVVGLPAMMAYWTFGFQQCKYGWQDVLTEAEVVANYSNANIPLEALWADIDYMDHRQVFTVDPERYPLEKMRELVDVLHSRGQKYVMMLDPGVRRLETYKPFTRGVEAEAFIKAADGKSLYRGEQWAGEVVWPDWFANNSHDWWAKEIGEFFDPETGLDIDGAWNDMNEVSNFCDSLTCDPTGNLPPDPSSPPRNDTGRPIAGFPPDFQPHNDSLRLSRRAGGDMLGMPDRDLLSPRYKISNHQGDISIRTLYTNNTNADGSAQYDTHNLYGLMMATASRQALLARRPNSRPFVLTRSTFAGAGSRAAHWFGDNYSAWDDYRISIRQMLAFAAVHAMPMVGSDVCGFNGDAQEQMCARWAMLAAFQPFYRNHADISAPSQEFYLWESVSRAAEKAIDARYRLLDYIYTSLHRASTTGSPIVSPVFFQYPADENIFAIDTQWFYGDALLVSPVVEDDATEVTYYLPNDIFYDFWTLAPVRGKGANVTDGDVPLDGIPVHIRGGTVVPLRSASANTTALVREKDFTLVIAPGLDGDAAGSLYLDDGDSVDVGSHYSDIGFKWDGAKKVLRAEGTFGYDTDVVVESVKLLGGDEPVVKEGRWTLKGGFEVSFA